MSTFARAQSRKKRPGRYPEDMGAAGARAKIETKLAQVTTDRVAARKAKAWSCLAQLHKLEHALIERTIELDAIEEAERKAKVDGSTRDELVALAVTAIGELDELAVEAVLAELALRRGQAT